MVALIAAICAFVSVGGFALYASGVGQRRVETRLAGLRQSSTQQALNAPFADRIVLPVFGSIAGVLIELLPHSFVKRISQQLVTAGSPMTTQSFFTLVAIVGIFTPVSLIALMVLASDGGVAPAALFGALFIGVVGVLLPFLWLSRRVRSRQLAIWKNLPDAFDLITVCVEAGLGLDAALRHVSDKLKGPFSQEVSQTLREVGMGRPRREALEDLADRIRVDELTTFVNSVIQAEQLGTSLGRVLRAQGVSIRTKRRQKAEELSRKAPVKMVFPLVLFIMPTFFIITLGPIIVQLVNYLSD
ncbi:MAG: type II secretion system F family protein [Chloroflexi bacterium]|nr:type II secretion system F family protein [Chloroflexota bacterium]